MPSSAAYIAVAFATSETGCRTVLTPSVVEPVMFPPRVSVACPTRSSALVELLDTDQVARRIADGAVANAIGLVDRLLDDVGFACLQAFECAVQVLGCKIYAR